MWVIMKPVKIKKQFSLLNQRFQEVLILTNPSLNLKWPRTINLQNSFTKPPTKWNYSWTQLYKNNYLDQVLIKSISRSKLTSWKRKWHIGTKLILLVLVTNDSKDKNLYDWLSRRSGSKSSKMIFNRIQKLKDKMFLKIGGHWSRDTLLIKKVEILKVALNLSSRLSILMLQFQ